jgi:cell division protein FtsI (penicillin-binding protein 3)
VSPDRTLLQEATAPERAARSRERRMRLRMMLLALGVASWAILVGGRLVQLQVFSKNDYLKRGTRQSERTVSLLPRRGPILDRHGRPLAVSVDAESVVAVPREVTDPQATAAALARELGLDAGARRELLAKLQKDSVFQWVERKVAPATAQRVRALQLPGIGLVTEHRRYYPQRELAAPVLGYVGLDNQGMAGLEYLLDQDIRGRGAKVLVYTDARRRPFAQTELPSTEGASVELSLDEAVQHIAERELQRSMAETRALAGMVIVVEPFSGEILAMAQRPTFNPNRYRAFPASHWRNRAVADYFEPGSIFKIVTAAAGLQERVVEPEEVIDCGNGRIEISGVTINDHAVFSQLTMAQAVWKSSDIGLIRVAQRLGRDNFERYVRSFGFGVPTGVDLPAESPGQLRAQSRWSALSLPSMSFGQEIGVTGLQMTMAAAAVANGGYLMKPIVVRRVEDASGHVVRASRPVPVRRVLEPETVDTLTEILRGVVREGTGRRAAIPGYDVAGKTGTAQKIDDTGRYSMIDHVASFVGFVPAARPALVVLASLDTPTGAANQGGDVAAPLFSRVATGALRVLAVPPDDPTRVLRAMAPPTEGMVPAAFRPQPAAARLSNPEAAEGGAMPDLRGRSAREAAIAAARRGLVVELRGSGRVIAQTPAPGSEVEPGTTCELILGRAEATP